MEVLGLFRNRMQQVGHQIVNNQPFKLIAHITIGRCRIAELGQYVCDCHFIP